MIGQMTPIAYVSSPFKEKFGTPRQAGLCEYLTSQIVFKNTAFNQQALRDIQDFSHLWVIFQFHLINNTTPKSLVRPPRLGGNKKIGTFATRSPFRPNPIGLSLIELIHIKEDQNNISLLFSGGDMVDGTPVIDIKPFIDYADRPKTETRQGWINLVKTQEPFQVKSTKEVETKFPMKLLRELKEVLMLDPRPRYKQGDSERYGMNFRNYNVEFELQGQVFVIDKIEPLN